MSLTRGSRLGLLAVSALMASMAGCALPQVLPVETGTTSGPSPYGVWYEQHWATNSVLLAAADSPDSEIEAADDTAVDAAIADFEAAAAAEAEAEGGADAAVEARADAAVEAEDFDASTPYQFPSSSYAPAAREVPSDDAAPAAPGNGPIRY